MVILQNLLLAANYYVLTIYLFCTPIAKQSINHANLLLWIQKPMNSLLPMIIMYHVLKYPIRRHLE